MKKVKYKDVVKHGDYYVCNELMDIYIYCPECDFGGGNRYTAAKYFDFVQEIIYLLSHVRTVVVFLK